MLTAFLLCKNAQINGGIARPVPVVEVDETKQSELNKTSQTRDIELHLRGLGLAIALDEVVKTHLALVREKAIYSRLCQYLPVKANKIYFLRLFC